MPGMCLKSLKERGCPCSAAIIQLLLCCVCVRGERFDASEGCENELMARRWRDSC